MSVETNIINIDDLGMKVTDEQIHQVYTELADIDKTSTDNLAAAEKETETSNYTNNNVIKATEEIPGVGVIPDSAIIENIKEDANDIKSVLDDYNLDDEATIQMLNLIEEYKAGKQSSLYSRLPDKMKDMVNGILITESNGSINPKQITPMRNNIAKMLIDNFISDAKMAAAVDDFNTEIASTINEINTEYDNMLGDAINSVFDRIEEIRVQDPEQANRIMSIKNAFDDAATFNRQLEWAKRTSIKRINKLLDRYRDNVQYFNKRVNSNAFEIKVNNIENLEPIIKIGLPQYSEEDIKKFIISICNTVENTDELSEIAYQYRMVSTIEKYKFMAIDDNGEEIFRNISKVIDEILS